MVDVFFDNTDQGVRNKFKIDTLTVDGRTIGNVDDIKYVSVYPASGLWKVGFKDGAYFHSTGNVFVFLVPV